MFTGIVEATAKVLQRDETGFRLARPKHFSELQHGQSIACNGACLTLTGFDAESLRFDIIPETFARTNLATADPINLERALAAHGRFEGHVVLGHVDATTELVARTPEGEGERWRFALPQEIAPFVVEKGSICLNGISLTIAGCADDWLEIALIPTTLAVTNLAGLQPGATVNVEADYFAKLLYKWRT